MQRLHATQVHCNARTLHDHRVRWNTMCVLNSQKGFAKKDEVYAVFEIRQ
jgi:hypothetical protein